MQRLVALAHMGLSFGDYPAFFRGVFDEKFKGWGFLICGSRPSIWSTKDVGWVPKVLNDLVDNSTPFPLLGRFNKSTSIRLKKVVGGFFSMGHEQVFPS